jgi:hypothetical protein
MIVIKDVPGLTPREVLDALLDLTDPTDPPIVTGHGGFVVAENLAERFLSAYLIATGRRTATVETSGTTEPTTSGTTEPTTSGTTEPTTSGTTEPTTYGPARTTTRRAGRRKEAK